MYHFWLWSRAFLSTISTVQATRETAVKYGIDQAVFLD